MRKKTDKIILLVCYFALSAAIFAQLPLPKAEISNATNEYFGVKVVDPYRWMEDLKADETQKWMRGQANYANNFLNNLPLRDALVKRLNDLSDAGTNVSGVKQRGERYFYYKQSPGENNSKLYVCDGLTGAERLLVDPTRYAVNDGQSTIESFSPSPDGKMVSFLIALGGGEYGTIRVLDVATGKEIGDVIENTRQSAGEWTPDGRAFAYNKFQTLASDAPTTDTLKKIRIFLHTINTKNDADRAIFGYGVNPNVPLDENSNPDIFFPAAAKYAVAKWNIASPRGTEFYLAPIASFNQTPIPWRKVVSTSDEVRDVAEHGKYLYLLTYKNALRFKIIRINIENPDLSKAEIVFGVSEAVVENMSAAKDALYVQTLDGGSRRIFRVDYKTLKSEEIKAPYQSSLTVVDASMQRDGVLFAADSWTKSPALFAYNPRTDTSADTKFYPPVEIDMSNIEVVNAKAKSHDGVMIPLVIIYKKGLKLNGKNPLIMSGYGAYGIENVSPYFFTKGLPWLERGGVYVYTGVRGGGEYGEEWHLGGFQQTKPNTWKDFTACAEYLIREKYTSPEHLGIIGGSAGGILISNSIAERPDLFSAAVSAVGINNALRYEITANGATDFAEFGTFKTAEGFRNLLAMDGYHKIKDGVKYPAVMLMHGVNDPRVDVWMSAKFAARLQAASTSQKPVLLRLDYDGGHGIGSSRKQQNEERADIYAFFFEQLK